MSEKKSTAYKVLTVLFWASLVIGLLPTISVFSSMPSNAGSFASIAIIFGNLLAYATIPAIIWVIRYFVGKQSRNKGS